MSDPGLNEGWFHRPWYTDNDLNAMDLTGLNATIAQADGAAMVCVGILLILIFALIGFFVAFYPALFGIVTGCNPPGFTGPFINVNTQVMAGFVASALVVTGALIFYAGARKYSQGRAYRNASMEYDKKDFYDNPDSWARQLRDAGFKGNVMEFYQYPWRWRSAWRRLEIVYPNQWRQIQGTLPAGFRPTGPADIIPGQGIGTYTDPTGKTMTYRIGGAGGGGGGAQEKGFGAQISDFFSSVFE